MATPIMQSVGSVSGAGTPGQGRNDLISAERVDLSDSEAANIGSAYFWEFVDVPIGTSPTIINPTTATPHFFVDADAALAGTYAVKVTVDGVDSIIEMLSKPLTNTGARIPAFLETLEYDAAGNAKGWHEAQTVFQRAVDSSIAGAPDASTTVKGIAKLSVAPAVASNPIAAGDNDPRMTNARTPTAHSLGGTEHNADTLANLNAKVSDATLIDTADARLSDARTPLAHSLAGAEHNADTLANLNSKVSDGTLIDTADSRLSNARTPLAHSLGGAEHNADTLANLNAKVSDGTLDDVDDPRDADAIVTTTGPTILPVGAVADGEFLKRDGGNIVGAPAGGAILENDKSLATIRASSQHAAITDASQTGLELGLDLTLEAWVFFDSLSLNQYFLGKSGVSSNHSYHLRVTSGNLVNLMFSTGGVSQALLVGTPSPALVTGRWYHIAATRNGTTGAYQILLDGVSIGSGTTATGALFDGTSEFRVGGDNSAVNFFLDGKIDEARVWDIVRTPTEIADNRFKVLVGDEAGLQGYWRLDGDFLDQTANANNLTASGGPVFSEEVPFVSGLHKEQHHAGAADALEIINASSGALAINKLLISDGVGGFTSIGFPKSGAGVSENTQHVSFVRASTQYAEIVDGSQVGLNVTGDITLEAWVRFDALSLNQYFLTKFDAIGGVSESYRMTINTANQMRLGYSREDTQANVEVTQTPTVAFVTGRWYHWAISRVKSTGATRFFVDGVFQGEVVSLAGIGIFAGADPFRIGGSDASPNFHLDGDMSDVRVWSMARSDEQIATSYTRQLSGTEDGLQGNWKLNGSYEDSSPNGNTLTAFNTPTFDTELGDLPPSSLGFVLESNALGKPSTRAGTADPSSGGLVAHEGSLFQRFVAAAGELWLKFGAANTAWAQVALLNVVQVFTKSQRSGVVVLTDVAPASEVAIDAEASNLYELTATGAVGATRILANPTNLAKGMTWQVWFIQDATGGRALTYGTQYDFGDEGTPDHTTDTANQMSIISCVAISTTKIQSTVLKGFGT